MESVTAEAAYMAQSAGQAFLLLMEPHRLGYLGLGCIMGIVLGIVPGIGGLAGTAMLLRPALLDAAWGIGEGLSAHGR